MGSMTCWLFVLLLDGAVEDGGRFSDVVELEAIDALDVWASVEAAAWLAACLADDLVILCEPVGDRDVVADGRRTSLSTADIRSAMPRLCGRHREGRHDEA